MGNGGKRFSSAFALVAPQPEVRPPDAEPEWADFATASALRASTETQWPWSSVGIAILLHGALLFLAIEWLQLYPVKFTSYTVPVSKDPPLEVAMVTEEPPAPQRLRRRTDAAPPDPTPPPPPPPMPVAELPPPPPAPVEMPMPTPVLPSVPPVVPETTAAVPETPAVPAPPVPS